jgi:hypothetical protein
MTYSRSVRRIVDSVSSVMIDPFVIGEFERVCVTAGVDRYQSWALVHLPIILCT